MTSKPPKPTLILKVGRKNIKEYTHGRIIQKLKTGVLPLDTLVHNPDGLWRKVSETPGFRTLCARLAGGPKGEAEKPERQAADHSLAELALPPFPAPVVPVSPHSGETVQGDEEKSLSRISAMSGHEFEIELEDDDYDDEEELNGDENKGLDDSDDSGEAVPKASDSEAAFNILDSSPAVSQPQVSSLRDSSDSANPFATKQYFRVKPKGEFSQAAEEEEPDPASVWKKRILIGAASFWLIFGAYWFWSDWFGSGPAIDDGLSVPGSVLGRDLVEAGETDPRALAAGKGNSKATGKSKDIWESQKKAFEVSKELYRQGK